MTRVKERAPSLTSSALVIFLQSIPASQRPPTLYTTPYYLQPHISRKSLIINFTVRILLPPSSPCAVADTAVQLVFALTNASLSLSHCLTKADCVNARANLPEVLKKPSPAGMTSTFAALLRYCPQIPQQKRGTLGSKGSTATLISCTEYQVFCFVKGSLHWCRLHSLQHLNLSLQAYKPASHTRFRETAAKVIYPARNQDKLVLVICASC